MKQISKYPIVLGRGTVTHLFDMIKNTDTNIRITRNHIESERLCSTYEVSNDKNNFKQNGILIFMDTNENEYLIEYSEYPFIEEEVK